MLKNILEISGVIAVVQFKDNAQAELMQFHGALDQASAEQLGRFAYDHKRMLQGMADVFAMLKLTPGETEWTPLRGWVIRGATRSVCSWAGLVCLVDNDKAKVNEVLKKLDETAFMI
ncbi:MAG: hypothetical protein B7Y40_04450 [Gammaproteobacteria bacterium 28-57-27]|nr:MAG: hypothetical protein B7Y40_04450 [Gammaproteobacteria bacterium 28-57-27]